MDVVERCVRCSVVRWFGGSGLSEWDWGLARGWLGGWVVGCLLSRPRDQELPGSPAALSPPTSVHRSLRSLRSRPTSTVTGLRARGPDCAGGRTARATRGTGCVDLDWAEIGVTGSLRNQDWLFGGHTFAFM